MDGNEPKLPLLADVPKEVDESHPSTPSTDAPVARTLAERADPARRKARERRRSLAKRARQGLLFALIFAAAGAAIYALRPRPVAVDVARASRGPLVVAIEETGATRVKDRFVVSSPATGTVSRLSLEPGDAVKEGDTLAELAPATSPLLDERSRAEAEARLGASVAAEGQARSQVERATAAKQHAEQELERMKKLADAGAIPTDTLEQAEFEARMRSDELASALFAAKVASEEVRVAHVPLEGTRRDAKDRHVDVFAPISGSVLRVHQKSAGVVTAGAPLVEVGDPAALEVVVDLLTTDAVHVKPGTPAVIQGWGGDGPLAGRVRLVEPSAFTRLSALGVEEQRVNVVVAITDPHDKWAGLADGFSVEVRFVLWESQSVLGVPVGAVFRHGDGWATYRIDAGVSRLVPVELGHRGDSQVEVISGLSEGAEVAVHPGDRVKDGARVEAR